MLGMCAMYLGTFVRSEMPLTFSSSSHSIWAPMCSKCSFLSIFTWTLVFCQLLQRAWWQAQVVHLSHLAEVTVRISHTQCHHNSGDKCPSYAHVKSRPVSSGWTTPQLHWHPTGGGCKSGQTSLSWPPARSLLFRILQQVQIPQITPPPHHYL